MSGIYFHIPFCKTRCIYCDFFSSTNIQEKKEYVTVLCKELAGKKNYLNNPIETVYFGGGTPSVLTNQEFELIFNEIENNFRCDWSSMEITLEANPDDLTDDYLNSLKNLPFNRISIGIQSFDEEELKFLNRRHNAQSAKKAVQTAQKSGFENISIDLMYGLPNQTLDNWKKNIRQAINLDIQHISAYHLIYEENTCLYNLLDAGKITPSDEDLSLRMFETLIDDLADAGFEQYEISNFAKKGYQSRHNSSYWNGKHYLGIGASAHSYNGISRQWNKASKNYPNYEPEIEIIDTRIAYNDFIITRLRTMKGISLKELETLFGEEKRNYLLNQSQKHLQNSLLEIQDHYLRLTRKGIFVSDGVMSDLFLSE